ncbi:MAG TPA: carboxypeptidase-like regulatory domain-containing protein, partial [Chloroflexia bacterium]|nr:carboxypeptidase-like regulatory domain-containing protein [Chloroflexia bacterium]
MRRRRRSTYSTYTNFSSRNPARKVPSPLPYLIVALLAAAGLFYFHIFAFKNLSGTVTNAFTNEPMAGVPVVVVSGVPPSAALPSAPKVAMTATTGLKGDFSFERVPDQPIVTITFNGFSSQTITAEGNTNLDIKMVPNVLRGQVVTPDGKPVPGASIITNGTRILSGADGTYELDNVGQNRKLVVKAPGYRATNLEVGQVLTQ